MRKLALVLLAIMAVLPLSAQQQEEKDSVVWLMSAKSAKMVDVEGGRYRKVIGPARFLHNGTYLLCDTALWNVETKIIDAWGNVSILQDETVLTSEKLTYLIDEDLGNRDMFIAYSKHKYLSNAAKVFIDILKNMLYNVSNIIILVGGLK